MVKEQGHRGRDISYICCKSNKCRREVQLSPMFNGPKEMGSVILKITFGQTYLREIGRIFTSMSLSNFDRVSADGR
jgi:hypothetical protein